MFRPPSCLSSGWFVHAVYGLFSCIHMSRLIDVRMTSNISFHRSDCLYGCMKMYRKTACTSLPGVNIWLFETFRRKYKWIKSLKMCAFCWYLLHIYIYISKCTIRETVKCSSTLSLTSTLDGLDGQHHASAAITPGKTRYPLCRRLGWPQGRSGRWGKSRPIWIRSSYCTARSHSLFRLTKEWNLVIVSCFAAGRDWHWEVGAMIRFVVLCFLLLVTTKVGAVVFEWTLIEFCLLWQAGAYLLS